MEKAAALEKDLRDLWNKQGIPKEKQDEIIREVEEKAKPGAMVGPFKIGSMKEGETVTFLGQPFEVISVYTRAQAIEDGVLIDVTEWAKEAGFKYPVAVTAAVYALLEPSEHSRNMGQSEKGRARDMFNMMHYAIKAKQGPDDLIIFSVKFGKHVHRLKSLCHPGDDQEPVITIMLPEED